MIDYYKVLKVSPDVSQEALREQYRFLLQAFHPDKFSGAGQEKHRARAEAETKRLNAAYEVLKNPVGRREYDRQREAELARTRRASAEPPPRDPSPPASVPPATSDVSTIKPSKIVLTVAGSAFCAFLLLNHQKDSVSAGKQVPRANANDPVVPSGVTASAVSTPDATDSAEQPEAAFAVSEGPLMDTLISICDVYGITDYHRSGSPEIKRGKQGEWRLTISVRNIRDDEKQANNLGLIALLVAHTFSDQLGSAAIVECDLRGRNAASNELLVTAKSLDFQPAYKEWHVNADAFRGIGRHGWYAGNLVSNPPDQEDHEFAPVDSKGPLLQFFLPKAAGNGAASITYDDQAPLLTVNSLAEAKIEKDGISITLNSKDTISFATLTRKYQNNYLIAVAGDNAFEVMHILGEFTDGHLQLVHPEDAALANSLRARLYPTGTKSYSLIDRTAAGSQGLTPPKPYNQAGSEQSKRPTRATIITGGENQAQGTEPVGNVEVTYTDGTKDSWTVKGNCGQAHVASDGTVGWTVYGPERKAATASYSTRPNGTLVLCKRGRILSKISSALGYIEDWSFLNDGSEIALRTRALHGVGLIERHDSATGKLLESVKGYESSLPAWAAPFADR